jgi:hypothetical protein
LDTKRVLCLLAACGVYACASPTPESRSEAESFSAELTGQWQLVNFPSIPIAAANLPNGKVITWASEDLTTWGNGLGQTYTALFDPQTSMPQDLLVTNTSHEMFCPGASMLPDGSVFVNGGGNGVASTSLYGFTSGTWRAGGPMNQPRWYNSSVTLPNGDVFTLGGNLLQQLTYDGRGERWSPTQGWTVVPGALLDPLTTTDPINRSQEHPRLFVAPNGKIFAPGPTPNMQWYDLSGNGSVASAGTRGDDTFSQNDVTVMFDQGKLLKAGGNVSYDRANPAQSPSSATSYVIDINGDAALVHQVPAMLRGRAYANGVVLPSGEVLVVGGLDNGAAFSDAGAVLTPELFDPVTETWSDVTPMTVPRTYHSVALLMPDGRVFAGGGGLCGPNCGGNHYNAEIFSPAYLFQAGRPAITSAPDVAPWGSTINVSTSGTVSSFAWIRMSSVTHSVNTDQRRIPAAATSMGNGNFSIVAPANGNLAPPGYYMLFALNDKIPSVAKTIRIGQATLPTPAPTSLALGHPATQSSTANGRAASLAVDGKTADASEADVTLTNADPQAFWQVDLAVPQAIGVVNVWTRTDCCSDRLTNFDVKLSNDGATWSSVIHVPGQAGSPTPVDFAGQYGRYVRVQLTDTNTLSLAEVEVFPAAGAHQDVACVGAAELSNINLACPASGEVITGFDFVGWGTPTGTCGGFAKGSCDAPTASQVLATACLGKASCSFVANVAMLGDPCSGTWKNIAVQARCATGQAIPVQDIVCTNVPESGSASLACPAGEVISGVDFASYGTPQGACGGFSKGSCDAANSSQVLTSACVGKASCVVQADNATFGDACSGTYKNLDVQVRCVPGMVTQPADTACVSMPERNDATLACPTGKVIGGIDFASYGTPQGPCGSFTKSSCDAASSSPVVTTACVGKASCTVPAANATFGDPCSGTAKRLDVQAHCVVGQVAPPPDIACVTAPERTTTTLNCPAGEVVKSVDFASYGTPTGTCGGFAKSTCDASSTLQLVSNACVGKSSCMIPVSNTTFGDPCSGTAKQLDAQVRCAKGQSNPTQDIQCASVNERANAVLTCPSGEVIQAVDFASYGNPSGGCGSFTKNSCDAANAAQLVSSACLGKASCTVAATNANFGDPCKGTYKAFDVQVRCGTP